MYSIINGCICMIIVGTFKMRAKKYALTPMNMGIYHTTV